MLFQEGTPLGVCILLGKEECPFSREGFCSGVSSACRTEDPHPFLTRRSWDHNDGGSSEEKHTKIVQINEQIRWGIPKMGVWSDTTAKQELKTNKHVWGGGPWRNHNTDWSLLMLGGRTDEIVGKSTAWRHLEGQICLRHIS